MKLRFLFFISIVSLAMASCYRDAVDNVVSADGDMLKTTITLEMPGPQTVGTYGLEEPDENYIRMLNVLVFGDDNKFLYQSMGRAVNSFDAVNGNKKDYEVLLHKTNGSDQVRLVILANSQYAIGNINVGEDKDDVMKRIVFSLPADNKWPSENSLRFDPFPMWGETGLIQVTGAPVNSVNMLRALAKIDVCMRASARMLLTEVYLYNINSKGRVVPAPANYNASTLAVENPTMPDGGPYKGSVSYENTVNYDELFYDGSLPDVEMKNQIYVPEAPAGILGDEQNSFCMVIGGIRIDEGGYGVHYYRVDFMHDDGGKVHIPVLRNHRYVLNIKKIEGPGYATPDEAFDGKVFNNLPGTVVDIDIDNTQTDANFVYYTDGQYVLKIPRYSPPLESDATTFSHDIWTDYPGGWTASLVDSLYQQGEWYNPETGRYEVGYRWNLINSSKWITLTKDSGEANTVGALTGVLTDTEALVRQGSIRINAGTITAIVPLSQYCPNIILGKEMIIPANYNSYNNSSIVFKPNSQEFFKVNTQSYSWYEAANVPYDYNSTSMPPMGAQFYPPRRNSCAASELDGHRNWRLPTINEWKAVVEYVGDNYSYDAKDGYGLQPLRLTSVGWSYQIVTAESDASRTSEARIIQSWYNVLTSSYNHNLNGQNKLSSLTNGYTCVRTVDESLYVKSGTEFSMPGTTSTQDIIVYVKGSMGLKWSAANTAQYNAMVASTQMTKLANVEHGYEQWKVTVTTKPNTTTENRAAVLKLSTQGDEQSVSIDLMQKGEYGFQIPSAETGLNYDLVFAEESLPVDLSWYTYANVPDGHHSVDISPVGAQEIPARANSCAAFTGGGFDNWRLPTSEEFVAIMKYMEKTSLSFTEMFKKYNLPRYADGTLRFWGSDSPIIRDSKDKVMALWNTKQINIIDKNTATINQLYTARCVRNETNDFYVFPGHRRVSIFPMEYKFKVYSKRGLNLTVNKDTRFDDVVASMTITPGVVENGWDTWEVVVNTKQAASQTDVVTDIVFNSTSGGYSQKVTLIQPAYAVEVNVMEFNSGDYGLMVLPNNLLINDWTGYTWYEAANVPSGYNTTNVPPAGLQVTDGTGLNGSNPRSCANLDFGGYTDWRLPTIKELKAFNVYVIDQIRPEISTSYTPYSAYLKYQTNLSNQYVQYYLSADSDTWGESFLRMTFSTSLPVPSSSSQTKSAALVPATHSNDVRCVRTVGSDDFFDTPTNNLTLTTEDLKIRAKTAHGIQPTVVPGASFDDVISGVVITYVGPTSDGKGLWDIVISPQVFVTVQHSDLTSFTVKSTDGSRSKTIEITQSPGNVVPITNKGLLLAKNELSPALWYVHANVPDGHDAVTPADALPPGQLNPARAGSCAALNDYGLDQWRMPTATEQLEIFTTLTPARVKRYYGGNIYAIYSTSSTVAANSQKAVKYNINSAVPSFVYSSEYKNRNSYTRCVHDWTILFESNEYTLTFDTHAEVLTTTLITKHGLQTTIVPGTGFSDVVDNVSFVRTRTFPDGMEVWKMTVSTISTFDAQQKTGEFILKSSDGSKTNTIKVLRKTDYIIPAEGLIVAPADQPAGLTWYTYANTDDNHNSIVVPPLGNQQDPARANSCAALTAGGCVDWRMPTLTEAKAMLAHYVTLTSNNIAMFNFMSRYYFSSTTYVSRINEVYYAYSNGTGSSYTTKTTTNAGYSARCVRPVGSLFEGASYEVESQTYAETVKLIVTTKHGLQTLATPGTNYSSVINGVTFTLLSTMPGGIQQWELAISTKVAASDAAVDAQFSVKSADGTKTDIITVRKKGDHIIPANNIMVASEDQLVGLTWYTYANTDDGHNSLDVPPLGNQQSLARANSCAALTTGGYSDWRLPTLDEATAMFTHYRTLGDVRLFGFSTSYYWTATTNSSYINRAYYAYTTSTSSSSTYKTSASTSYGARCVRTVNTLFEGTSYEVESQTYAETVKLTVTTQYGLQSVATPGTNYSSVINGVTFTLLSTMPGGLQQWELAISTKNAVSETAVDAQFSVKSADGTKTNIITVRKKGDFIISAKNIMVALEDQPAGLTWYAYANTDDGHNSLDVPPLGNQQNPARTNSCAALTTGGYSDWRLPTLNEATAMFAHYRTLGDVKLFGFLMSMYWTANTYNNSGKNTAYQAPPNGASRYIMKNNAHYSYSARCVRTL